METKQVSTNEVRKGRPRTYLLNRALTGLFQISEAIEPGFASKDSFDNRIIMLDSLGEE